MDSDYDDCDWDTIIQNENTINNSTNPTSFLNTDHQSSSTNTTINTTKNTSLKRQRTLFDFKKDAVVNLSSKDDRISSIVPFSKDHLYLEQISNANALQPNHQYDENNLKTWIYPINYSLREYQYKICLAALASNTLVCLPTGLGKTFIAAVVMFNYFRWFPDGKIIFMAPTKPLVNQQIEACFNITAIPQDVTVELTGTTDAYLRKKEWNSKRIFFMTPQTLANDLQKEICPIDKIVLVVVDEAHRAIGNYAYCDAIKILEKKSAVFRVLALSATPGSDMKKVQMVVQNLLIQNVEVRSEDSPDVKPYVFNKQIEEIVLPPSPFLTELMNDFAQFISPFLTRLYQKKIYYTNDPLLTKPFGLMEARKRWLVHKHSLPISVQNGIEADFAMASKLSAHLQILKNEGMKGFYEKLSTFITETKQDKKPSKYKLDLIKDPKFTKLMTKIELKCNEPDFYSHPKLERLVSVVQDHFRSHQARLNHSLRNNDGTVESTTKIMIFSTHRSSVNEIVELLQLHSPTIRPTIFVGQSKAGMTQKQQHQTILDFKSGRFNVLVATSIAEEGLDIGEVDLIICYDNQSSSIKMLQRCGRTGRKRAGKIILLINKGSEEQSVRKARNNYKSIQNSLADAKKIQMYDGELAAVLPQHCRPVCEQVVIEVPEYKLDNAPLKKVTLNVTKNTSGPFLSTAQQQDYESKFFAHLADPLDAFITVPINKHNHWQTTPLPLKSIPRSSRSLTFSKLMARFETLREKEIPPVHEIQSQSILSVDGKLVQNSGVKRTFNELKELPDSSDCDFDTTKRGKLKLLSDLSDLEVDFSPVLSKGILSTTTEPKHQSKEEFETGQIQPSTILVDSEADDFGTEFLQDFDYDKFKNNKRCSVRPNHEIDKISSSSDHTMSDLEIQPPIIDITVDHATDIDMDDISQDYNSLVLEEVFSNDIGLEDRSERITPIKTALGKYKTNEAIDNSESSVLGVESNISESRIQKMENDISESHIHQIESDNAESQIQPVESLASAFNPVLCSDETESNLDNENACIDSEAHANLLEGIDWADSFDEEDVSDQVVLNEEAKKPINQSGSDFDDFSEEDIAKVDWDYIDNLEVKSDSKAAGFSTAIIHTDQFYNLPSVKSNNEPQVKVNDLANENMQSSSPVFLMPKARRRNRVVLTQAFNTPVTISSPRSKSPMQRLEDESPLHMRNTPLMVRLARKKMPRNAPKQRGTPVMPEKKSNVTKVSKKMKPVCKNNSRFFDLEAELSADTESISSDEDVEPDGDLSGFIASQSEYGSANVSPNNMNFYRKSLLSPEQGGFGRAIACEFVPDTKFKKPFRFISTDEDPSSLVDFVCGDEEIEYESDEHRFIDDTQPIPKMERVKNEDATESQCDFQIDDLIDLDDYL
ncbi:hypothetical protein BC833DRAFT_592599 [Globomyces pollinis-pini]|nr:hypothetical protein BC833DRAFT_592599 [Globomyces pollinis-pini]